MEQLFFSQNNKNLLYNLVATKLHKDNSFDISNDLQSFPVLEKVMNAVFQKQAQYIASAGLHPNQANQELSKKVLETMLRYYRNKLNPEPRPISTYQPNTITNSFNEMQQQRNIEREESASRPTISFETKLDESTENVLKNYELLAKERESMINTTTNYNNQFSLSSNNTNTNLTKNSLESQFSTPVSKNQNIETPFQNKKVDLSSQFKVSTINELSDKENESYDKINSGTSDKDKELFMVNHPDTNTTSIDRFAKAFSQPIQEQSTDINQNEIINEMNQLHDHSLDKSDIQVEIPEKKTNESSLIEQISKLVEKLDEQTIEKVQPPIPTTVLDTYFGPLMDFFKNTKTEKDYTIKTYNLIVNSADRQWYSQYVERRTTDSSISPSFTGTREEFISKYGNIDNWNSATFKDLEFHQSPFTKRYNYTIHFGNDSGNSVSYDDNGNRMEFKSNGALGLDRKFRNVESIRVKRVILPNIDEYMTNEKNNQIYIGAKTEPYLLVAFDEYTSNIVSSTANAKNVFSKVIYDRDYHFYDIDYNYNDTTGSSSEKSQTNSRGFIHLIDEDLDYKLFYPSPLSELSHLTFSLLRPNGELYSQVEDNLQVTSIEFNGTPPGGSIPIYMILTLNKQFQQHYFKQGDKIVIKNFTDGSGNPLPLTEELRNYFDTGAYVYQKSTDTYSNQVYISYPVKGYEGTDGTYTEGDDYIYDAYRDLYSYNTLNTKGFIINLNHQHTLILEVRERELNSRVEINPQIV